MISFKVLALLMALSGNALASAGALPSQMLEFASHSYLDGNLKLSSSQQKELECLTKVVWYEARGESKRGKILVANVVQNRTTYGKPFATTICDVVYQRSQFSWTLNKRKRNSSFKQVAKKHWKTEHEQVMDTVSVAMNIVIFGQEPITTATHFCSKGEKCNFKNVRFVGREGAHTFFEYLGNL